MGAITVDSTTAQQISQLQGAVKGLTNLVKGVQLNTNPTQSSQNSTSGTVNLLLKIQILHLHLEVKAVEVEVEVEEVLDLGQVNPVLLVSRFCF